jgi:hypothetical protein
MFARSFSFVLIAFLALPAMGQDLCVRPVLGSEPLLDVEREQPYRLATSPRHIPGYDGLVVKAFNRHELYEIRGHRYQKIESDFPHVWGGATYTAFTLLRTVMRLVSDRSRARFTICLLVRHYGNQSHQHETISAQFSIKVREKFMFGVPRDLGPSGSRMAALSSPMSYRDRRKRVLTSNRSGPCPISGEHWH